MVMWEEVSAIPKAYFRGTETVQGIESITEKTRDELTLSNPKVFSEYLQALLLYRAGQRLDWAKGLNFQEWEISEESISPQDGSRLVPLLNHKNKKSSTKAAICVIEGQFMK